MDNWLLLHVRRSLTNIPDFCPYNFYLDSGSRNNAIMMVASTMHVRYMVLISKISESGGLSRLSMAWLPITQKLAPHNRSSSSDSIVLLSLLVLPPPWAPLDSTAERHKINNNFPEIIFNPFPLRTLFN